MNEARLLARKNLAKRNNHGRFRKKPELKIENHRSVRIQVGKKPKPAIPLKINQKDKKVAL